MARKARPWHRANRGWFVWHNGKQVSLGATEDEAQRQFKLLTNPPALPVKRDTRANAESPTTLTTLLQSYLEWHKATRASNSTKVAQARLAPFLRAHGEMPAESLTPAFLELWTSKQGWSHSHRHSVITQINAALKWAIRERLLKTNPIEGVSKPPMEARTILLGDEDHQRILGVSKPDLRIMLALLDDTGARPNVLCSLRADSLFPENGCAIVRSKNKPYHLYLSEDWMTYLLELAKAYPDGPLLRTARGKAWTPHNLHERMKVIGAKLGIVIYPYLYRSRFATRKLAEGVSPAVVAALLNHANLNMLSKHYNRINQKVDILREQASRQSGPI